ncbi:MAG TPA: hypothetical protein VIX62_13430 [Actinomycetota bacterium]
MSFIATSRLASSFWPEMPGFLEKFFVGLLALLVVAVGVFALFLIANQFRNPGRRPGEGP